MAQHRPSILVESGIKVLNGRHDQPSETSQLRGWRGVMVEYYRDCEADFTAEFTNHGIRLQLAGSTTLYQRSAGMTLQTQMHPGNIAISPAAVPKSIQHQRGGEFLVIHVAPDIVQEIALAMHETARSAIELRPVFCARDPHMQRLCIQLLEEYRNSDRASGINAEALATQLAVHLLRHYSSMRAGAIPDPSKLTPRALQRAIEFIDANLAGVLTVGDLAKELSISAAHFAHSFRAAMGVPPHRYINDRRIELAKTLLRETAVPIATVAARAGFSTHAHFCVVFQRTSGISPSRYRKSFRSSK